MDEAEVQGLTVPGLPPAMVAEIDRAKKDGDSVGGEVEVVVRIATDAEPPGFGDANN